MVYNQISDAHNISHQKSCINYMSSGVAILDGSVITWNSSTPKNSIYIHIINMIFLFICPWHIDNDESYWEPHFVITRHDESLNLKKNLKIHEEEELKSLNSQGMW